MALVEQPFRQIHLDFHTSEHIPDVGAAFDPEAFAETLERARVNSVNCFARGWHGWIYYDSKRFPEAVHPNLVDHDLLPRQIEACHRRGIRMPIYVAVQVDHRLSQLRPNWTQRKADGSRGGRGPFEAGWGPAMCLNTPFAEFLFEHLREVLDSMPIDGFWFDGVSPQDCCCQYCLEEMASRGADAADLDARKAFGLEVVRRFEEQTSAIVRASAPDATLFYNAGHIGPRHRLEADHFTHFEIESLPSGGWGYLHFPTAVRLARTMGRQVVGMTGKFHTAWGDFHSFKNPAALEFECFQMLAQGAACSIGDQLHPSGVLCPHTYELIRGVYEQVEDVEPWCRGAKPVTEIAVLSAEPLLQRGWDELLPDPVLGAVRLFQEEALQFDIVDIATGVDALEGYRLLVLPDEIPVDEALRAALDRHRAGDGSILASHRSGLTPDGDAFACEAWPATYEGDSPFAQDFFLPGEAMSESLPATEHVMYDRGVEIRSLADAEILARKVLPYFDRSWRHFCSHRHAPSSGADGGAAVVQRGRVIYCAHPLFGMYRRYAPRWIRQIVSTLVDRLLIGRVLRHNGPSSLLATVLDQPAERRRIVHLLHYIPERRGRELDIIEDPMPVRGLELSIETPGLVAGITLEPQGRKLDFRVEESRAIVAVPDFDGRQIVAIRMQP